MYLISKKKVHLRNYMYLPPNRMAVVKNNKVIHGEAVEKSKPGPAVGV